MKVFLIFFMCCIALTACVFVFQSCTLSFQNVVSVNVAGQTEDLIDEDQKNDPNISPNIEFPIKPL